MYGSVLCRRGHKSGGTASADLDAFSSTRMEDLRDLALNPDGVPQDRSGYYEAPIYPAEAPNNDHVMRKGCVSNLVTAL